jgi:hypothetical protein
VVLWLPDPPESTDGGKAAFSPRPRIDLSASADAVGSERDDAEQPEGWSDADTVGDTDGANIGSARSEESSPEDVSGVWVRVAGYACGLSRPMFRQKSPLAFCRVVKNP